MRNAITGGSLTAPDVDFVKIVKGQPFSLQMSSDSKAGDSSPEQGAIFWAAGEQGIAFIEDDADPTGGEDYYPNWYAFEIGEGKPLRRLTYGAMTPVSTDPYTYTLNLDICPVVPQQVIRRTSGTTEYWDIGMLEIQPRIDDASLDQFLKYGGTTMASMTDGATEVATQAAQTSDVTLTTRTETEKLTFQAKGDTASLAYGVPFFTVAANGKLELREAFLLFSTNQTKIGVAKLLADGWFMVSDNTLTAEKMFAKKVGPWIPANGYYFDENVDIPLDVSQVTASAVGDANIWMVDANIQEYVASGAPTATVYTAYGLMNSAGLAAVINDEIYTVSSGATATQTLFGDWTNAA